jgi:predicted ATPase
MITRVQIRNFRGIANADVELGPLTVLVGRNGAGKSAFLDALRFVRDALRLGLDDAITHRNGISSIRRWSPAKKFDIEISLTIETEHLYGNYSFLIGSDGKNDYKVKREEGQATQPKGEEGDYFKIRDGKWEVFPTPNYQRMRKDTLPPVDTASLCLKQMGFLSSPLSQMSQLLQRTNFFAIYPNTLREPQKPSPQKLLQDSGENFASALRQFTQRKRLPELIASLDAVVGGISDIRVRSVGGFLVAEMQHNNGNRQKQPWFELAQESDGTLRLLGLLVALYQVNPGFLTAIEEPELTLHPGALGVLSDVLREAATRSQVIVTTQSPDLISRFGADELRIVERSNGITRIGPLDETQREAINRQLFSAGDLLRIEGLHRASMPGEESSEDA